MRFNRTLLLLPLLGACATPAEEYPNLAIRDAERATGTFAPAPSAPYVAEAPAARSAVAAARAAEFGSDSWARASVALAGLEGTRSRAMIALADLDRLMVDAAVEGGELERIVAVRDTVTAQVDEQNATIEALSRTLR